MNRRNFIRTLSLGIAAGGLTTPLIDSVIPQREEYPDITYKIEYDFAKLTNLHSIHGEDKNNARWCVFQYSDDAVLKKKDYKELLHKLKEKIC
jgi:hypothetical protein